ncbi:MAG: hypothetical protein RLZZ227_1142 [Pseudomonadota bacterium]|jgi:hypothetical protein
MLPLLLGVLLSGTTLVHSAYAQDEQEAEASAVDPDRYTSDKRGSLIFDIAALPEPNAEGLAAPDTGAAPAVTASPALAADASSTNPRADIAAYRSRIADTQATDDAYSNELREQYDSLGTLLQQSREHEDAIAAFESAMHIDRVNTGLYTLDQIPLVEKMIASHEALGNIREVNDLHEYLFYIQQRSYAADDPRLLAAKEDWADWNLESFLRESALGGSALAMAIEASPQLARRMEYVAVQTQNGSYVYIPRSQLFLTSATDLALGTSPYSMAPETVIDQRLLMARDYYEELAETDAGAEAEGTLDSNARIQRKLASVAYAVKQQMEEMDVVEDFGSLNYNRVMPVRSMPMVVSRGYISNRDLLEARATELEQDPTVTAQEKAQAWIDLGDWHVGFDYASRSEDAYRKAWTLLSTAGLSESEIAAIFMPALLVPAPGFVIHDYSRALHGIPPDAELPYKGHMDLSLTLSSQGDVRNIDIEAASPNTPQVLRSTLLDYLREQKMRPAIVNGEAVERDNMKLRYYYTY